MPSPVQSNCDAHDTIANGSTVLSGQWDTHNRERPPNVSTCKPTNSCLDDSIRLDGKGTTWCLPIIPGVTPSLAKGQLCHAKETNVRWNPLEAKSHVAGKVL
ncbi:hypothetical protein TNCV_680381 [Trichonephila clavipes]|nr:hypothetical protein TNCV_680381 [Trichonephila clavipes]